MKHYAATLLRWAANRLDPIQKPAAFIRGESAFVDNEHLDQQRREDALRMVDPETHGYVLLLIRDRGGFSKIELTTALLDFMWPPVKRTLAHVITEGQAVYGRPRAAR